MDEILRESDMKELRRNGPVRSSNPIRVLIDPGNALPSTGIGVYAHSLLEALRQYGKPTMRFDESRASSYSSTLRPLHRVVYLYRLNKMQKSIEQHADVVHFANVYTPRKRSSVGFVTTIPDLDAVRYPDMYSRRYRIYVKRILKESLLRSDIVLTISNASKSLLSEYFGNAASSVRALHIGVSEEFARIVGTSRRRESSGIPVMLYVGSLSTKKNTAWLIRTTCRGVKTGAIPKLRLMLVGSAGYGFGEIERELKNNTDCVEWRNNVSKKELVQLYLDSNIVTLPSMSEGFGLPLIEAMYCGKAIVASKIPSSLEIASEAADYFDLDDADSFYAAVRSALEDIHRKDRIAFISKHIEKFLWRNLVPEYEKVYQDAARAGSVRH